MVILEFALNHVIFDEAIKSEHYQLPIQQRITGPLSGDKQFSKIDTISGFCQIPLDNKRSYLTTVNTPFRRFRSTVVSVLQLLTRKFFMEPSSKSLQTLRAVKLILMIFLVWCQTIEEKEKHLEKVLDCGKEINLTLSADKCEF